MQRVPQVIERRFAGRTIAHGSDTWPELGRCTPDTILILFEGVRYVHGPAMARSQPVYLTSKPDLLALNEREAHERGRTSDQMLKQNSTMWPLSIGGPLPSTVG